MPAIVETAERCSDADLRNAMCAAFADYLVTMQPTQNRFDAMMLQRGLDRSASRIAIIDGEISAIWLVARRGRRSYLIASGTLPRHRGKGIARLLAAASMQGLRGAGATSFQTEVLEENIPARDLYLSLGMEAHRSLTCFTMARNGLVGLQSDAQARGRYIPRKRPWSDLAQAATSFADWPASWQNDNQSLEACGDQTIGLCIEEDGEPIGVVGLIANDGTLAQIAVSHHHRRQHVASELLAVAASMTQSKELRLLNAQSDDRAFAVFLQAVRAKQTVRQIELMMQL